MPMKFVKEMSRDHLLGILDILNGWWEKEDIPENE